MSNKNCGIDLFSNDAPIHLQTNKIIEAAIVSDIIRAPELSMSQYKAFINERLIEGTVKFYIPIKINKLNTRIKKTRRSHHRVISKPLVPSSKRH